MPRRKRTPKPTAAAPAGVLVYRVKVALPGAGVFYVLSTTKPAVHFDGDVIASVDMTPIEETEHGDTLAHIRWADVSAVAWRPARIPAAGTCPDAGEET